MLLPPKASTFAYQAFCVTRKGNRHLKDGDLSIPYESPPHLTKR